MSKSNAAQHAAQSKRDDAQRSAQRFVPVVVLAPEASIPELPQMLHLDERGCAYHVLARALSHFYPFGRRGASYVLFGRDGRRVPRDLPARMLITTQPSVWTYDGITYLALVRDDARAIESASESLAWHGFAPLDHTPSASSSASSRAWSSPSLLV